jgi:hypothetical protein
MRASSSLLVSSGMAMGLTITAIAIAVILLASNFTTINAQQQFSQPGEIENGTTAPTETTTFQSTDDSFSIQVPQGWIIQDVNNTGPTFLEERTQGYGILAQLCPEEQQGAAALSNASGSSSTNTISSINASRCQGAQDVIHIIRYPDLETRMQPANNITAYHLQKLQEVGYRGIQTLNSADMTVNITNPQTNETITTVPGTLVEMTYSTNSTPDETRRGHFVLFATNATTPSLGATKGYSVFYEGNSITSATAAEITTAAASLPPPPAVEQVFDSFELIAAPEVAQAAEDGDDDDDDNGGDDDDNGGDDDDNGGDDDDNGGDDDDNGGDDDDNGGDDDDNGDNGEGDEGEGGGGGEGNPNEFDDCIVPPGMDPGDVGC